MDSQQQAAVPAAPAPLDQVAGAVISTVMAPTPENIIADIKLALDLFLQFKTNMNGLHPSAWDVIKQLL